MRRADVGACLFTNPMHIRFATGTSVMPVWTALNLARYALIPAEGDPIVFEYGKAVFRTKALWETTRPAVAWQQRFSQHDVDTVSKRWAEELASCTSARRLAVDPLDVTGFRALERAGFSLVDSDEILDRAKLVKSPEEINWLKQACSVAETALFAMEKAIVPGISENELFGIFHERMLALGGEVCSTRLIASGERINPWFREASDRRLRPGDLVGIDTDMTGAEGYLCDISRTFLCGDRATPDQKDAYRVAHDFIESLIPMCRPGTSHATLVDKAPKYPEAYAEQGYSCMIHGAGFDDEPPFLPFPHDRGALVPHGELQPGMVLCVEFYAGKKGKKDGVKLEEQILVTDGAPERLSRYPYEAKLL